MRRFVFLVHPTTSETFRTRLANIFGWVRTMRSTDRISMVVCGRWEDRKMAGAVQAECADCRTEIAYMPHAPSGPPKVCWACAGGRLRTDGDL